MDRCWVRVVEQINSIYVSTLSTCYGMNKMVKAPYKLSIFCQILTVRDQRAIYDMHVYILIDVSSRSIGNSRTHRNFQRQKRACMDIWINPSSRQSWPGKSHQLDRSPSCCWQIDRSINRLLGRQRRNYIQLMRSLLGDGHRWRKHVWRGVRVRAS